MSGEPAREGTAHIELILDEEPDSPRRTSPGSWRQFLRQPTEGERLIDERIIEHLRPYLDPHTPIEPDPGILDIFKVPHFTEGESILIRALARIRQHCDTISDPWEWLQEKLDNAEVEVPLLRPHLWSRIHPVPAPGAPFEPLVQSAREARINGHSYEAVQLYSQALQATFTHVSCGILVEAQDATVAWGLRGSGLLNCDAGQRIGAEGHAHHVARLRTPLDQLQYIAMLLLLKSLVADKSLAMDTLPTAEYLVNTFKQLVPRVLGDEHATAAQQLNATLMMAIACLPLVAIDHVRPLSFQSASDTPTSFDNQNYCTDLLFHLARRLSHWNPKAYDAATTDFVRYRIALACRAVQPYMNLPPEVFNPSGLLWDLGVDALRALGRDRSSLLEQEGAFSPRWPEFASVLTTWLVPGNWDYLEVNTASELSTYLDTLVASRRYDEIEQLCQALLFVRFRSDVTVSYGIRRFLWWPIPVPSKLSEESEGMLCHPRGLYAVGSYRTAMREAALTGKRSMPSAPIREWDGVHARLLSKLRVDCTLPTYHDMAALEAQFERWEFFQQVGQGDLSLLTPFFSPHFATVTDRAHTTLETMYFIAEWRPDSGGRPAAHRHLLGLGRPTLSSDRSNHEPELEEEMTNLHQLYDDITKWVAAHHEPSVMERNQELLDGFTDEASEDYNVLYDDIFDVALRADGDDPILRNTRAWILMYLAQAHVELAACSSVVVRDTMLLRACEHFKASLEEGEQLGTAQNQSAQGLAAIQADFWRRGVWGIRAEQVLEMCFIAERCDRFRLLAANPATEWIRMVTSLFPRTAPFTSRPFAVRNQIHCIAREICLSRGMDMEAFWWMQKAKADMVSGIITQQKSGAALMGWITGDRTGDAEYRSRLTKVWKKYRARAFGSRENDDFRVFLTASRRDRKPRLGLPNPVQSARSEFDRFSKLFKRASIEGSPGPLGGLACNGRLVWVDWLMDAHNDLYHVCVIPIPGIPEHFDIDATMIRPSHVANWVQRYWNQPRATMEESESVSPLRDLDAIVSPLRPHLREGDIVVLCPTGALHPLPLHVLCLTPGSPLIASHPVVYAASCSIFEHCTSRCRTLNTSTATGGPTISAVYHPLSGQGPEDMGYTRMQEGMREVLGIVASDIGASFRWDKEVTKETLVSDLQTSPICTFVGHCVQTVEDVCWSQHLVLSGKHRLYTNDFYNLAMPPSLLLLIGCGTSEQPIIERDEPMGFIVGAMSASASSVVGTLWPVHPVPAVHYARRLGQGLRGDEFLAGNNFIDLARAHQRAVLELRETRRFPADWAAYVLHGSPVMRDLWRRSGEAEVWPKTGDEGSGHTF